MQIQSRVLVCLALGLLILMPCFAGTTKGDSKRGKKLFQDMQCAICHANGGNNLNPERPLKGDSFLKRFPAANNNKDLEKVIREGITQKGMPAFPKDKMSDQDLADVVAFIRGLSEPAPKGK